MWTCRGISKSFLVVAPCRSFPSPVAAMVGSAALGLSRELRTRPIRNRPRTSRWGQVEHKPVATSSTYVDPPQLAHSSRATSCRNKTGPYRDLEVGFAVEICGLVFAERKAFLKNRSYRTEL